MDVLHTDLRHVHLLLSILHHTIDSVQSIAAQDGNRLIHIRGCYGNIREGTRLLQSRVLTASIAVISQHFDLGDPWQFLQKCADGFALCIIPAGNIGITDLYLAPVFTQPTQILENDPVFLTGTAFMYLWIYRLNIIQKSIGLRCNSFQYLLAHKAAR